MTMTMMMIPGSEARDGAAETEGAVVVTVSSPETERSGGAVGGGKAAVEEQRLQQQGKGAAGGGAGAVIEAGNGGDWSQEKVCRICHLSPSRDGEEDGAELMQLGCGCKDDLGTAHRGCAEAWFRVKGNRCCEICGANAKNITGGEAGSRFMTEWHEGRMSTGGSNTNSSERVGCWRSQPFCNFLLTCLVIAFILPWFFRVNMF